MERVFVFGLSLAIFFGAKAYINWKAKKNVDNTVYAVRPVKEKKK